LQSNRLILATITVLFLLTALLLITTGSTGAQDNSPATSTPIPTTGIDDLHEAQLRGVEQQVSALRELPPPENLARVGYGPGPLLAWVDQDYATYGAEDAREDLLFYTAFGLMPEETDLRAIAQQMATSRMATFYDPETDTMRVQYTTAPLNSVEQILYADAYTYALQDANFEISRQIEEAIEAGNDDLALALQAFRTGDARLSALLYGNSLLEADPEAQLELLQAAYQMGSYTAESWPEAPPVLSAEIQLAVDDGLHFVEFLYGDGDWGPVNNAYLVDPPLSTEHILHPKRYLEYDLPLRVELRPLSPGQLAEWTGQNDWQLVKEGTLGEFYLRQHLRIFFNVDEVNQLASGWGGDSFMLYHSATANAPLLIWELVWDTPEDATEFNFRYGAFVSLWLSTVAEDPGAAVPCWEGLEQTACLSPGLRSTLVVLAPNAEIARQIIDHQQDPDRIRIFG